MSISVGRLYGDESTPWAGLAVKPAEECRIEQFQLDDIVHPRRFVVAPSWCVPLAPTVTQEWERAELVCGALHPDGDPDIWSATWCFEDWDARALYAFGMAAVFWWVYGLRQAPLAASLAQARTGAPEQGVARQALTRAVQLCHAGVGPVILEYLDGVVAGLRWLLGETETITVS